MKLNLANSLPESVLMKIRKHAAGSEALSFRKMPCHYCEHKTIIVYEDSRGHIGAKCKKCGKEGIYNVLLRRRNRAMTRHMVC
jgi:ribosomal protein S27E